MEKIEISPRNEEFNASAIRNFIRDYKGDELKKWDVFFASGDSDDVVDILGAGHEYRHPERQFSVESGGKILKMSGSKRRIGTTLDERFGLSEEGNSRANEIAEFRAKRKAEATGKPVPEKINTTKKDYYAYGIKRNPLFKIYFVGLKGLTKDKTEENEAILDMCKDTIYIGFGLGIPWLENQETKYARYVLNKVALQKLYEDESDNWDDEEEYDD